MKNKKQIIKCYNINYSVEEEDIKDTPYEHRNDLSVNQKIELLKSDLETDNLYKVGSTKEVIIDDDVKLINHFINNRELLIDKCRNFTLNNISIEIGSTKLSKIYERTFF